MNKPSDNIVFLTLPESFRKAFSAGSGKNGFKFDLSIPLPIELPEGETSFNPADLTVEMLVSGMLRVIAEGKTAENLFYYRNFVLAVRPDILKELGGAAILKGKNGDYHLAREIITILKALAPDSPEVLFLNAVLLEEEAEALSRAGSEKEAALVEQRTEAAYNEALAAETPLPDALFNAAFFYMKRQKYSKAREYFSEYAGMAEDAFKKETALAQIRVIEKQHLDDEYFASAYNFISEGKEIEGMEALRCFLEKHPEVWNAWFLLGWALRRLRRWEDGAQAFRKALELGGDNPETRNELAICLIETGNLPCAKKELEAALVEEPENVKIISNMGILYLKMGDKETAESFFRTVLEIEPNDPLAKKILFD